MRSETCKKRCWSIHSIGIFYNDNIRNTRN